MVVINENTSADNGVIHENNCVMYVQPREEDKRLSHSQKKEFQENMSSDTIRVLNNWNNVTGQYLNYGDNEFYLNKNCPAFCFYAFFFNWTN